MANVFRIGIITLLLAVFAVPQTAFAHAALIEAVPDQNSVNAAAPEQITLTFNERLERGLYFIQVYNEAGDLVTKKEAQMSDDRRQLSLPLPRLRDGTYTVSWRVVSADGHPVTASYVFHVGHAESAIPVADQAGHHDHHQDHHSHHHHHDHAGQIGTQDVLLHAVKAWYYISLLLLAGLLLWQSAAPQRAHALDPEGNRLLWTQRSFLLALLAWIGLQASKLIETWKMDELSSLLNTSLGRLWIIHLVLAFLGFVLLRKNRFVDAAFAGALLGVKALSGHAAASEPAWSAVLSDAVHLAAGALWTGGLLIIVTNWKSRRNEVNAYLPMFSRFAWISIVVLSITGIWLTARFLPGTEYLTFSTWGTVLIIKAALVALVVVTAALIRRRLKKNPDGPQTGLLAVDVSLAVLIIAAAAVLSSLNPVPSNEPLHWHEMGEHIHMTAQISPNAPGHNRFAVKVWLPEGQGAPKQVRMQLVPMKRGQDPAPLDIPLAPSEDPAERDFFLGFDRYDYGASGKYMAFAGEWKVVVRVLTPEDVEYVYEKQLRIY